MKRGKSGWMFVLGLIGSGALGLSGVQGQTINNAGTPATAVSFQEDAATPAPVAEEAAGCDSGLSEPWTLFGNGCSDGGLNIGGWFAMGIHTKSNELFNTNPDSFDLSQGWLFVEKEANSKSGELAFGFRFDGMYGVDGPDTQSFGNQAGNWDLDPAYTRGGNYGWAIPQLYGEVAMGDLSVKIGHFYTLAGYEVVGSPGNFFYSHAITMYNSEPFTHTGAIATYEMNDCTSLYGGWTAGWDTGFDQFGDGSTFLGGFSRTINDDASFSYITSFGDLGARGDDAYSHSMILDLQLTERLQTVFQSDVLRVNGTGEDNFALVNYMFYTLSDRLTFGRRIEWWKGDNVTGYAPHGGDLPSSGSHSQYEATYGFNYKATGNLTVRPEYRYDWSPGLDYKASTFGIDFVMTF
jgi:hypothetical protein